MDDKNKDVKEIPEEDAEKTAEPKEEGVEKELAFVDTLLTPKAKAAYNEYYGKAKERINGLKEFAPIYLPGHLISQEVYERRLDLDRMLIEAHGEAIRIASQVEYEALQTIEAAFQLEQLRLKQN